MSANLYKGLNQDYEWDKFNAGGYVGHNYASVQYPDEFVANAVIERLASLGRFGHEHFARDVGVGGALRTVGLIGALLAEFGVHVELTILASHS
jgi:hypothetical protein